MSGARWVDREFFAGFIRVEVKDNTDGHGWCWNIKGSVVPGGAAFKQEDLRPAVEASVRGALDRAVDSMGGHVSWTGEVGEKQQPVPVPAKEIQVMDHVLKQLLEYTGNLSGKMPGLTASAREAWDNLCLAAWPPPEPKVDHNWMLKVTATAHAMREDWGDVKDMHICPGPALVVEYLAGAMLRVDLPKGADSKAYFAEFQQEMVSREDDRE